MFKFTLPQEDFQNALMTVFGAVDKKQSLPILSNILLELQDNHLRLLATDLEIEISAEVVCDGLNTSGKTTVPAKKIIEIIRSLENTISPVITCESQVLTIKSGRSQFKIATLPADNFPVASEDAYDIDINIPRLGLIQLFNSTHFAMSAQDVRIYLNGLMLAFDSQFITAIATDGHRMAIAKFPFSLPSPESHLRLLLPKKGIQEILRLLHGLSDETVLISANKNQFKLTTKGFSFITKLIDTRFPPYAKAIPKDQDKFVLVDRDILKRALSRMLILAHEKSRVVILQLQSNTLMLIAHNQSQEESNEIIEAHTDGGELKIAINASYLLDVLNHMADGLVRISLSDREASILVESLADEHYQYVIMPTKL